jgi:hypothetical protein
MRKFQGNCDCAEVNCDISRSKIQYIFKIQNFLRFFIDFRYKIKIKNVYIAQFEVDMQSKYFY